jgi:hypothetical protein
MPTPTRPQPRSGFGAVYSRVGEFVAIVGGRLRNGHLASDLWLARDLEDEPIWHRLKLPRDRSPTNVESATYARRDGRIWLVDDPGRVRPRSRWHHRGAPEHGRLLYRIDPGSGRVETVLRLRALDGYDRVWLIPTADGRVVLAAANDDRGGRWALALLQSEPFREEGRVELRGARMGTGRLGDAPRIEAGVVNGPFVRRVRHTTRLFVDWLAAIDELDQPWHALKRDVR